MLCRPFNKHGVRQLEGKALETAAKEWLQYLQNYDEISSVFDSHCSNGSGFLDKDALTAVLPHARTLRARLICKLRGAEVPISNLQVLTDLNEGEPPDPADVEKVLEQASIVTAGQLSKPVRNRKKTNSHTELALCSV